MGTGVVVRHVSPLERAASLHHERIDESRSVPAGAGGELMRVRERGSETKQ